MTTETGVIAYSQPDRKRILPRDQFEAIAKFPKELSEKFQPLYCGLCEVRGSSNKSIFAHYNSKQHKKKVNRYLEEWSLKTGEPMPKKLCVNQNDDGVKLHCEACDLVLTSKQHAQQHYMGKQHQKVIAGKREPTGFGHYDKDGKWVRMESAPDKTGRFGIGTGFLPQNNPVTQPVAVNHPVVAPQIYHPGVTAPMIPPVVTPPEISVNSLCATASKLLEKAEELNTNRVSTLQEIASETEVEPVIIATPSASITELVAKEKKQKEELKVAEGLFCHTCHITVTSAEQMKSHQSGVKHLKRLRQTTKEITYEVLPGSIPAKAPAVDNTINVCMFRTPSGNYYCKPCDLTVDSEYQFRSHLTSKRHKKGKNKYFA
ncbi:zinc finger protein 346-like [Ctenocephalides felis]|uniref:zinc finger protein 346-like n=1 Tax=Ctenocephalides felis TaxID=7515 RepID=UPI000E6E54DE|nr:zinc finger protein 346-like [Ctenocephalides felis]